MRQVLVSSVSVLVLLVSGGRPAVAAGQLDRIRDDVRKEKEREGKKPKSDRKPKRATYDDSYVDDESWRVFMAIVTSPFWLPHTIVGDDFARPGSFVSYPYAGNAAGHMRFDGQPGAGNLSQRILIEDSNDFEGVNRVRGHLLLATSSRFGLEADFTHLTEELGGGGTDELSIAGAGVLFRFAQSERVQMRAGVGAHALLDGSEEDGGAYFFYGGDFFPQRPIVVSAGIQVGNLGNAAMWRWRVSVGAVMHRYELFAGYDSLSIGSVTYRGPLVGGRCWF